MAGKNIRNTPGFATLDPSSIVNNQYNDAAGSQKVSEVGIHPLPFPFVSGSTIAYTTNLTTARPLPKNGMGLAVYNNDTSVHSITLGESATSPAAALAAGITDAAGHVGIPCIPARWTYIACGTQNWVIADSALLLVFLIDDNSQITNQIPAQVPGY
jgi:hypothetical protein